MFLSIEPRSDKLFNGYQYLLVDSEFEEEIITDYMITAIHEVYSRRKCSHQYIAKQIILMFQMMKKQNGYSLETMLSSHKGINAFQKYERAIRQLLLFA